MVRRGAIFLLGLALAFLPSASSFAEVPDTRPRTAIITAFPPEKTAIMALLADKTAVRINGAEILTGTLEGHAVLLAESGISMVNAAMTAQMLLDRFNVERIVFSGIAGGVDPALHVGDVVVPEEWAEPMESVLMRETPAGPKAPDWLADEMMPVRPFGVFAPKKIDVENHFHPGFKADPGLLEIARRVGDHLSLKSCSSNGQCLGHVPRVLVGGLGVSTMSFADNAKFREWLYDAWKARATDMESAAVAQVAYVNSVPFIAFRCLSDLAGGEADSNRMDLFMTMASENAGVVVKAFVRELPKR